MKQKNDNKGEETIILQKYIAESGFCSRRKAEDLIKLGKVRVNMVMAKPGQLIKKGDLVKIGNKAIESNGKNVYILLNKPKGYISTSRSFKNEKNVFDLLKGVERDLKKRLKIAGRLDKDSRGLMLLTTDGDYIQKLTHPSFEHEKEYIVEVEAGNSNTIMNALAKKLEEGVMSHEHQKILKAHKAEYLGRSRFKIILRQGLKRQIREMFKESGLKVRDLKRVRISDNRLDNLKEKEWKYKK